MMKNLLGMSKQKKQGQLNIPVQQPQQMMFQPGKRPAYDDYSEEGEMLDE